MKFAMPKIKLPLASLLGRNQIHQPIRIPIGHSSMQNGERIKPNGCAIALGLNKAYPGSKALVGQGRIALYGKGGFRIIGEWLPDAHVKRWITVFDCQDKNNLDPSLQPFTLVLENGKAYME